MLDKGNYKEPTTWITEDSSVEVETGIMVVISLLFENIPKPANSKMES